MTTRSTLIASASFATALGLGVVAFFGATPAKAGGPVENSCVKSMSQDKYANPQETIAHCQCIGRYLPPAGMTAQEEFDLARTFDFDKVGKIMLRNPAVMKQGEACMRDASAKIRRQGRPVWEQ